MTLFVLIGIDKPGALELRMANREAHFAYLKAHDPAPRFGGPFLDEAGNMAGSMLVIEAESLDAAKAFQFGDPYAIAGLFERTEIRAWRMTFGQPA